MPDWQNLMDGLKDVLLSKGAGKNWNNVPIAHKSQRSVPSQEYRLGDPGTKRILENAEEQRIEIMPALARQTRLGNKEVFWVEINQQASNPLRFDMSIVVAASANHEMRKGQRALFNWDEQVKRAVTITCRTGDGYSMDLVQGCEDKRIVSANGCWWFEVNEPLSKATRDFKIAIFE